MADPVDLSAVRWDRIEDPEKHEPADALRAALRAIESGERSPTHAIVLFGYDTENGGSKSGFYQAGTYRLHAQLGLLEEGKALIRENCK